jgi:hypothetical protein
MTRKCEIEDYGNQITSEEDKYRLLNGDIYICDNRAKHSMVVKESGVGQHKKMVFRLCNIHFNQLQDDTGLHDRIGCNCTSGHTHYIFRRNRL